MTDDFNVNLDGVTVKITGLRDTLRAMEKAGTDATDLKDLMQQVGNIVVHAARPPRASGALASTVRAGRSKTKAVVRAGTARTPYAGVIHYGWPSRHITAQPFLVDALDRTQAQILAQLDKGIQNLLSDNNL